MNYLEIRISDNGCGIEEDDYNKIAEPFYTTRETGTGLGLAIVNRIVESHSGTITIESGAPKKGTSCILLLPKADIVSDCVSVLPTEKDKLLCFCKKS
jgi:signal transduction histidine kinase